MKIISCNKSGLCNRLKNIISCIRYAKYHNIEYEIFWQLVDSNMALNCELNKIYKNLKNYDLPELEHEGYVTEYLPKKINDNLIIYRYHNFLILDKDNIPKGFDTYDKKNAKYSKNRNDGRNIDFNFNKIPLNVKKELSNEFLSLELQDELSEKVENFSKKFFNKDTISVHIRSWCRTAEESRHKSLFKNGISKFEKKINKCKENNPNANFYIASDSPSVINHFKTRKDVVIYPRTSDLQTSRFHEEGIKEDVIELYLLSKNKHIIGSHNSSYTEVAWFLAGCPKKIDIV